MPSQFLRTKIVNFQADTTVPTHNRSSRFMADPAKPDVALAGSQTPIIEMDNLSTGALISVHLRKNLIVC